MASSPRSSVLVIGRPDFCSPGLEEPSDSFSFSCSDSLEEARSAIESRAYGLTLIDPSLPGVKEGSALDEITRQAPGSIRMLLDRSLSVGAFAQKLRAFLGEKPEPIEPNAKLSALIESSEDAIFTKSLDGIIQSWNPGAQRMYGYSPDEIIGRSVEILMPQERKGEAREILAKIKSGERVRHYESRRLRKDGSTFDVSLSISPIRDSVGAIIEACTIARDISERTQAEDQRLRHQRELEQEFERKTAELRDEKDFVESLFESLPGIISIRSSDGRLLKWNKEYEEVTGFSGEELVRLNAEALAQIPEAASVRAVHQKTQEVGRSVVEALIRTKDKRLIPYGFISVRGRYAGIDANISMGIDISEASRVTERLREENAFSESLIQNMPGVLIIRDFDFKLLKWNKNLETVTGYSGEELQSLDNRVLADPVQRWRRRHDSFFVRRQFPRIGRGLQDEGWWESPLLHPFGEDRLFRKSSYPKHRLRYQRSEAGDGRSAIRRTEDPPPRRSRRRRQRGRVRQGCAERRAQGDRQPSRLCGRPGLPCRKGHGRGDVRSRPPISGIRRISPGLRIFEQPSKRRRSRPERGSARSAIASRGTDG